MSPPTWTQKGAKIISLKIFSRTEPDRVEIYGFIMSRGTFILFQSSTSCDEYFFRNSAITIKL
jgi:hypothetical protein